MPAGVNTPFFEKARTKLGVKPKPPQPIYDPELIAELIVYAATHPVAELYGGGGAKALSLAESAAPRLTEYALRKTGFAVQRTDEPRNGAPDNLFHTVSGHNQVHGKFGDVARRRSLYNWFEMHPASRFAVAAALPGITIKYLSRKS